MIISIKDGTKSYEKIIKQGLILLSLILIFYSIFSIGFGEYIYYNNKILGYYGDNIISNGYFVIPGNNIRLFDFEDKKNSLVGNEIQLIYSKSFLSSSRDYIVSFNNNLFTNIPKKDFSLTNRISNIFMHNEFLNEKDLLLLFSEYYRTFINTYGEANYININNGNINYIWMQNNEILYMSKIINSHGGYYYINIGISDKRFIYSDGKPNIGLFKKDISSILLISRFGFMKKIWYIDN